MSTKKSKHKNRAKQTKNVEEIENVVTSEKQEISENVPKSETLMSEEENKPLELVSEPATAVESDLPADAPKKPKRSKAKKKKEVVTEDSAKVSEITSEIVTSDAEMKGNIESQPIIPSVRKKKKKGKKQDEEIIENKDSEELHTMKDNDKHNKKENVEKKLSDEVLLDKKDETCTQILEKEETAQKKKKKKKNRHDSEKSDKSDPCILAFQKLLQASNDEVNVDDVGKDNVELPIKDETEPSYVQDNDENITIQDSNKCTEFESKSNKKKNKKGKKQPTETYACIDNKVETVITEQLVQNISHEEVIFSENNQRETCTKEKSPKPKAVIAKPVQKKRKGKTDISESSDIVQKDSENKGMNIENELTAQAINLDVERVSSDAVEFKNETRQTESGTKNEEPVVIPQVLKEIPISTTNDQSNQVIIKIETDECLTEQNKGEEKEVSTAKEATIVADHQKSSTENREDSEIFYDVPSTDKEESGIKSEESDTQKVATPDLIEYPRSTSQQLADNNNNTYIQEIKTTDEVKLNIPLYTPTPIIQGSGESPEVKIKVEPIESCNLNVTEIVSPPDPANVSKSSQGNKEKTDIKSKMIEVNRDMEELRLSIERSLAEFTAIDKNDNEVEKQFEEIFQSQTNEKSLDDKKNEDSSTCPLKVSETKESIKLSEEQNLKQTSESVSTCKKELRETDGCQVFKTSTECLEVSKTKNMDVQEVGKQDVCKKTEPEILEMPKITLEKNETITQDTRNEMQNTTPICPARRDKGKGKSKKKGKKEISVTSTNASASSTSQIETAAENKSTQKDNKSESSSQKSESSDTKGKQQTLTLGNDIESVLPENQDVSFEPIENFEDALTSSAEDVNKTFEIIANEATNSIELIKCQDTPQINIIAPTEDTEKDKKQKSDQKKQKQSPVSQPKNLLGHPNIPASSNKSDYKKEKNKPPNSIQAKVKIKDSVEIEKNTNNHSKESHIDNKKKLKECNGIDSYSYLANANEDLVYKYSFRKVFLQSLCQVCRKNLVQRVPCKFCSLVFYCCQKHKDEDWPQHQSLCFAVSTIAHLKEQKHIYADTQNITGYDYRILRMQMILSCEKILKRKLVPWEQEALLYPRICADVTCREWKQGKLSDCEGCGQISYCTEHPNHLPSTHQRWCKSYALYQKLVNYQQTKGRLEPRLPTKVLEKYQIPGKLNEVLGSMYEEKIDMDDIQYAALTQVATVPLTAAYCHQVFTAKMNSSQTNGISKKTTFTIHTIGAELPFEVDTLNKWETFFLHLRSDIKDLRVVMIGPDLNPSNLPLDLLAKIKFCENCQTNRRRVLFDFHEKQTYHEYYSSNEFVTPDLVCAFNPHIQRLSSFNATTWPATLNCILKQRVPLVVTSHTQEELRRDLGKIRECAKVDFNVVSEIKYNPFSSMRPDRNFITDDEIPLLFKNYCFSILCGTF